MDLLKRIRGIGLPAKEFVVIGSAILEIKGIRASGDIDIMISEDLFIKIKNDFTWKYINKKGKLGDFTEILEKDCIQLFHSIYGEKEDFNYFFEDSSRLELIDGIYFASLSHILYIKRKWNREKDKKDIIIINNFLNSKQS